MLSDLQILPAEDVIAALAGQERDIIEVVKHSYLALAAGDGALPHSCFLRFSESSPDRIIALPAYLKKPREIAGIKWVSSVPSNPQRGMDRASALIVINDRNSGRATAVLEGSIISAKRTAASAALAASVLGTRTGIETLGLIGLGVINLEVLRFLRVILPSLKHVCAYDLLPARVSAFTRKCAREFAGVTVEPASGAEGVISSCALVSIATTATRPHIESLAGAPRDAVVLHLSLRDFGVDAILASDNVVDDIEHVCRAQTSVHLAAERVGHKRFMRELAPLLSAGASERPERSGPIIFSPFGLGVLDLAVASLVLSPTGAAKGTVVRSFHAHSWQD
jgi:N-[(2S)-2-amino-2-carboxyethyl]-L-glutamate dehydrogenase